MDDGKHLIYGLTRTGTLKAPRSALVDAHVVIDDDTIQLICNTFNIVPKIAEYKSSNYDSAASADNVDNDEGGQTDTTEEMPSSSSDDESMDLRLRLRL